MKALNALTDWTGRLLSWLTLFMVVVTFGVVILRYGFGVGWIAMQESVLWMHGMVLMLGSAYTLQHEAHVRVDVFYRQFGARTQALVDLAGTVLLLLPVCAFILWSSWGYVSDSWALAEQSREAGGLPALYLLKTVIPVAAVLLVLEGVAMAVRSWRSLGGQGRASQKRSYPSEKRGSGLHSPSGSGTPDRDS